MTRSALALIAAVLAMACFACVPPQGAPPPPAAAAAPPPPPAAAAPLPPLPPSAWQAAAVIAPASCTASTFAAKISYLTLPFNPGPGKAPPVGVTLPPPGPGTPDYKGSLIAVFNAAPPAFQQALCTLDAVYINAVPCTNATACFSSSWGWWQSRPTLPYGRIVALSANLWSMGTYSEYETDLTQSLLPFSGVTYAGAQSCSPSGVCRPVDTQTTALLAALAHEVGHIAYFVLVNSLSDPTTFCSGDFYGNPANPAKSPWATPVHRLPLDNDGIPFRHLLTENERDHLWGTAGWLDHHRNPPHMHDIDHPPPGGPTSNSLIDGLVATSAPWASPFAAMSPDEDFVETYKFAVLTTGNPPLTSVTITVPNVDTANIVQDYLNALKPKLATKVACVPLSF